jgi:anti-sigma regulatory factor (Ser/Thr protein kinase)
VPAARRFVREALAELGLQEAYDAAEMLVSEVVTNAVLHAKTDFTVAVAGDGDAVRVSVSDRSPAVPHQRRYGTDATTGRGMRLVATLATAWGVDRQTGSKTVWFEVPAGGEAAQVPEPWDADVDLDAVLAGFDDLDADGPARPPTALHGRAPAARVARAAA